jgi:hypothetical protein
MQDAYLTVYLRREFSVASAAGAGRLVLEIDYDDGFVAYLNGEEVARSASMGEPGTEVTASTEAASHEAGVPELFALDTAPLRDGVNVLAVEVHNARIGSADLSFIPELTATFSLIDGGDLWRFRRGSEPPPDAWNQPAFDDGAWEVGPTGIGYGDGDDATVLVDMQGNYLTVFCRKAFEIPDPTLLKELLLSIIYDDGVVVYVNGEEVARANVASGPVGPDTAASTNAEAATAVISILPEQLRAGTNLLAVSVHNASRSNSDLSFNPVLVPIYPAREVNCVGMLRGDVNDDGQVDIADSVGLLARLFAGGQAPPCLDAADANDDGAVDLSDAIRILIYLFDVGDTLPEPGGACGPDPTPDVLGACSSSVCGDR